MLVKDEIGGINAPLILTTQGRRIESEVNLITVGLLNTGFQTARDAMPHLRIEGDDRPGLSPICWLPGLQGDEDVRIQITTDKEVLGDPDEIAEFLRKEYFVDRMTTIRGSTGFTACVAFIVKGSKFLKLPRDYRHTFGLPATVNGIQIAVSMDGFQGSGVKIPEEFRTFIANDWQNILFRKKG